MKKRNKFSLSHYKLLSCDMGQLVPIGLTEVIPGDTIQQATSALIRSNPLVSPVMHPVHARIHHWFVPFRLIWDDFEKFITGGASGNDTTAFPTVTLSGSNLGVGTLADYLGVPGGPASITTSALPFRAYQLIWNEFYRDQDLQAEQAVSKGNGSDTTTKLNLMNCAWEKDYFTSARPWEQKGNEVLLPLGSRADVVHDANDYLGVKDKSTGNYERLARNANNNYIESLNGVAPPTGGQLYADLSTATAASINDIRLAFALQRYKEARARYGSRYVEYLRYLGVKSSDSPPERPEYLGGGKNTIQFSEVLQTAEGTDPVGALKGHGIGAMRSNRYRKFFEEHGYVLSFLSVKPKTIYAQGLPRLFNKRVKEDFFQAELQHIGAQEILAKELYVQASLPDKIFGYQDRYDEYRRSESSVAGQFRTTLDYWHMARIFANEPTLNSDFVSAVPTKRCLADQNGQALLVMANHSIQARRLLAKTGSTSVNY